MPPHARHRNRIRSVQSLLQLSMGKLMLCPCLATVERALANYYIPKTLFPELLLVAMYAKQPRYVFTCF